MTELPPNAPNPTVTTFQIVCTESSVVLETLSPPHLSVPLVHFLGQCNHKKTWGNRYRSKLRATPEADHVVATCKKCQTKLIVVS
jgi:hypothetical protein